MGVLVVEGRSLHPRAPRASRCPRVWWDVAETPDDLDSYRKIQDWADVSPAHRDERNALQAIVPRFDLYESEHDLPELADRRVVE